MNRASKLVSWRVLTCKLGKVSEYWLCTDYKLVVYVVDAPKHQSSLGFPGAGHHLGHSSGGCRSPEHEV